MSWNKAREVYGRIQGIGKVSSIVGWYQETMMPPGGSDDVGSMLSEASVVSHYLVKELSEVIGGLPSPADEESSRELLLWQRLIDSEVKLPEKLVKEYTAQTSKTMEVWKKAKAAKDFKILRDDLQKVFDLTRQKAEFIQKPGETLYDTLTNQYEPGFRWKNWEVIEKSLLDFLPSKISQWKEKYPAIANPGLALPVDKQHQFIRQVLGDIGFDWNRGRLDISAHPFCTGGGGNTLMTTRLDPSDCVNGLSSAIHECGHGTYEQNLPAQWKGRILGESVGLGIHESQSRFWENIIGRSFPFCEYLSKLLQQYNIQVSARALYEYQNSVVPSLIRVESDEATYNLHIIIRARIERDLIEGAMTIDQLPERWNDSYKAFLGVAPTDDSVGVMQDVHWPHGLIGYFPTYTIGNLVSAILTEKMTADGVSLAGVAKGEFAPLLQWMNRHVHSYGSRHDTADLLAKVTGGPATVTSDAFCRYLGRKFQ